MKVPSTSCVERSSTKFCRIRGVNWLEASCRATMVTEKSTPVTEIRLTEIVLNRLRAPLASPP
jgi:hypothetical protein